MKILMLADSLDTGGAESHIETLALGLEARGHEVVIASFGGSTARKLMRAGIKCIELPRFCITSLSSPPCQSPKMNYITHKLVLRELIAKTIDKELPDIVHAHTRMTTFLVQSTCRTRKIPLITTAHAKFSMNFPKNLLTKWGDALICVSEDIKNHILSQPAVAPKRIKVIFNGVSALSYPQKRDCDSHKIVFVSRLDKDCSLGARILCKIATRLAQKFPNLTIKIVGGGAEYNKILPIATNANQKLNRELIKMLGKVENPTSIFDGDELFVGVSRAALEGMALGLPVILLGNEGYLGLINEGVLPLAMHTNFTCRGFCVEKYTPNTTNNAIRERENPDLEEELFQEIVRYFELSKETKAKIGEFSQRIVAKYYSADKMIDSTLEFYKTCLKRRQVMTVLGYYGQENFGDESVLRAILKSVDKTRFSVEVIKSKDPHKMLKTLDKTDLFVFGGGSLLQNCTSDLSLLYYLIALKVASKLCRRKIMLSNGIGPIENSLFSRKNWLKIIGKAVNNLDFISTRDSNSQLLLQNLLKNRKISLLPDPALLHFSKKSKKNDPQDSKIKNKIVFIPCANELKRHKITEKILARELKTLSVKFEMPVLIIILNPREDCALARELCSLMGAKMAIPQGETELKNLLLGAKLSISQRYHGALFSVGCDVPTLALSDDPKMQSFCAEMELKRAISPSNLFRKGTLCGFSKTVLSHHGKNSCKVKLAFLKQLKTVEMILPRTLK